MTTLAEIRSAILGLPPLERAELKAWLLAQAPGSVDPEVDSPELEAELLRAVEEPQRPYHRDELRAVCTRVVRELRRA